MKKLFLFLACAIATASIAQQKLTLTDAINTALKNSYDIQLAQNSLEISGINNNAGVAGALPLVTANASDNETLTSINQKFPDPSRDTKRNNVGSNNLSANVTGSILLFNGLRVQATRKRLDELQQQNQQLLAAQIQNTIATVMAKYYDVVRQQYFLQALERTIEVSKQKLSILEVRKEVGVANNADIFQAQLDLNANLQTKQSQFLAIDQAKTDLLNLIFLKPANQPILIKDTIIIDKTIRLDSVKRNLSENPLVVAQQQQIRINELVEKEAKAALYPTIRASTGFNLSSQSSAAGFILLNQSYGPFIGLNVAVPIYNGSILRKQQQIAGINTRSAKAIYENLLMDYETGAVKTYQTYKSTIEQIETERENYILSQKLLDLITQKFELGNATIIDVKQAQQSFETASFRLINLSYTAKVAEIELNRLASKLKF